MLAACSSPDPSPVPAEATGPFACAGVPLHPVELMTGTDDLVVRDSGGGWRRTTGYVSCGFSPPDGGAVFSVRHVSVDVAGFASSADVLAYLEDGGQRIPIEADAPGAGYISAPEGSDDAHADWTCDDFVLQVNLYRTVEGRDPVADLSAFVTSVLPWACGDEDAPPADVQAEG